MGQDLGVVSARFDPISFNFGTSQPHGTLTPPNLVDGTDPSYALYFAQTVWPSIYGTG